MIKCLGGGLSILYVFMCLHVRLSVRSSVTLLQVHDAVFFIYVSFVCFCLFILSFPHSVSLPLTRPTRPSGLRHSVAYFCTLSVYMSLSVSVSCLHPCPSLRCNTHFCLLIYLNLCLSVCLSVYVPYALSVCTAVSLPLPLLRDRYLFWSIYLCIVFQSVKVLLPWEWAPVFTCKCKNKHINKYEHEPCYYSKG